MVPTRRQQEFLSLTCEEALYGGAAGGGKSEALLMWLAEGVHLPEYSGIIFRRTYKQLEKSNDSLISKSHRLYKPMGAAWNGTEHKWTFPSGAIVEMGHLQHANSIYDYQGPSFHRVAFDELTQFMESQYLYLFSRIRRTVGFPITLGMRAASNPGGEGHLWVKKRFVTDEALRALRGMDSRTASPPGSIFHSTADRVFVPARLADNPHLDAEDYERKLAHLPPVTRERLKNGDWSIQESSLIREHWLRYYGTRGELLVPLDHNGKQVAVIEPHRLRRFCTADTAGTSKQIADERRRDKSSWSVEGVWDDVHLHGKPWLFLRHVWRDKVGFTDLIASMRKLHAEWGGKLYIENAHFGPAAADALTRTMPVVPCELVSTATRRIKGEGGQPGKVERASNLLIALEEGRVFLPDANATWLPDLESEWLSWTGDEDEPADQIDMASHAVNIAGRGQGGGWSTPTPVNRLHGRTVW